MDDYTKKHYQPPPINPYKILGIPKRYNCEGDKKGYKEKMRIFHPDKYRDKPEKRSKPGKGPEEDFRSLSHACSVFSLSFTIAISKTTDLNESGNLVFRKNLQSRRISIPSLPTSKFSLQSVIHPMDFEEYFDGIC